MDQRRDGLVIHSFNRSFVRFTVYLVIDCVLVFRALHLADRWTTAQEGSWVTRLAGPACLEDLFVKVSNRVKSLPAAVLLQLE